MECWTERIAEMPDELKEKYGPDVIAKLKRAGMVCKAPAEYGKRITHRYWSIMVSRRVRVIVFCFIILNGIVDL